MDLETSQNTAEAEIRRIIETWANAVRTKDGAALASHVDDDVLLFDLITPLQSKGSDALKERATQWLSSFQDPPEYEVRNLEITAGTGVAFCHSLNHVNGTTKAGQKVDMWWRATVCFRKEDGHWSVTHEHSSIPFDMITGKASFDQKP